jgi:hypothetical protein
MLNRIVSLVICDRVSFSLTKLGQLRSKNISRLNLVMVILVNLVTSFSFCHITSKLHKIVKDI